MERNKLEHLIEEKVNLYLKTNHLHRKFVTDEFVIAFMKVKTCELFIPKYEKFKELADLKNSVYRAAAQLFEIYLENYCSLRQNGHHAAQKMCELFNDERTVVDTPYYCEDYYSDVSSCKCDEQCKLCKQTEYDMNKQSENSVVCLKTPE